MEQKVFKMKKLRMHKDVFYENIEISYLNKLELNLGYCLQKDM